MKTKGHEGLCKHHYDVPNDPVFYSRQSISSPLIISNG